MGNQLSSATLLEESVQKMGLHDFSSHTFKEGLEALIHSLNSDIDLGEGTAAYFKQTIQGLLTNRLQFVQYLKDNPEIFAEKIEKPIVVLGLPRSGTTLLHTLLALNPTCRYLRNYETFPPLCPPPKLIPRNVDPRINACHEGLETFFSMAPNLRGINGINFMAHGTAECQNLMALEFVNMGWSVGSSLISYGDWVSECNLENAYKWHKLQLQLLQYSLPNEHWALKAPLHLFGLDQILNVYPDARFIFTHRDPLEAMTSGVSMTCQWTEFTTQQLDVEAVSKWYPALWAKGLKRALKVVEGLNSSQYIDIAHQKLISAPVNTIEKIYDHFNIPKSNVIRKRLEIWLRENSRSTFGNHKYSIQDFNINPEAIEEQFTFYQPELDSMFC